MANKSKFKKIVKIVLTVFFSFILLTGLCGLAIYNFVIIPKYNSFINQGEKEGEKLTNKDIITFAKLVTDKQLITNLANLDKHTAKDVLSAMLELEDEITEEIVPEVEATQSPAPTQAPFIKKFTPKTKDSVFTQVEIVKHVVPTPVPTPKPAPTPTPTPFVPPKIPEEINVPKEQQTAYDRIMQAASKEEIQTGMAIISKVDLSKVSELNNEKDRAELKKYLKSVLSSSEISTSLKLYRKYKHLL